MNCRTPLRRGLSLCLFLLGCSHAAEGVGRTAGGQDQETPLGVQGQETESRESAQGREPAPGREPTQGRELPLGSLESRAPSPAQIQAILGALGCSDADRLPYACRHCVGLDGDLRPRGDFDAGLQMDRAVIVLGRFAEDRALGAMVTVTGCTDRAAGDHDVSILGFEDGTWSPVATWSYNDTARCVFPRRPDGREHIVCAVSQGSQGCYDTELDSPRALTLEGPLGPQADEECAGRAVRSLAIEDVDDDGDEDIVADFGIEFVLRQSGSGFSIEPAPR